MEKLTYNTKVIEYYNSTQLNKYTKNITRLSDKEKEIRRQERNEIKNSTFENFVSFYDEKEETDKKERSTMVSRNRTIQKIYSIARAEEWEYFLTFTFDPKKVNRQDYDDVSKKLKDCMYFMKKNFAPDLKYLLVPELHDDGVSFHFHGVMSNIGHLTLTPSGHLSKTGQEIFNLKQYYLGFSNITKVKDTRRVSSYITKYITKGLCAVTNGKKRYWASRNLNKPKEIYLNIPEEDFKTLVNSYGDINYASSITSPQGFNRADIVQVNMD